MDPILGRTLSANNLKTWARRHPGREVNPMKRQVMLILISIVLCHGCSRKPDDAFVANEIKAGLYSDSTLNLMQAGPLQQVPETAPAPQTRKVVIPEGTNIQVITIDAIEADADKINSTFLAALSSPLRIDNDVIVPERTNVYLRLLAAEKSGKLKGKSEIHVTLDSMEFQGDRYVLQSSSYDVAGKSQGKQTAKKVGIGAALGTAVGAIAGGGKGAAIGAAVGGGGGLATQALKKGEQLQIPSETKLEFKLEKPLELELKRTN